VLEGVVTCVVPTSCAAPVKDPDHASVNLGLTRALRQPLAAYVYTYSVFNSLDSTHEAVPNAGSCLEFDWGVDVAVDLMLMARSSCTAAPIRNDYTQCQTQRGPAPSPLHLETYSNWNHLVGTIRVVREQRVLFTYPGCGSVVRQSPATPISTCCPRLQRLAWYARWCNYTQTLREKLGLLE
jgi:hypothetical protein